MDFSVEPMPSSRRLANAVLPYSGLRMLNTLVSFSVLHRCCCDRFEYNYLLLGVIAVAAWPALVAAEEVTAERSEHGVVVKIDGSLFAEYLTCAGRQPVIWPIIGPTGEPVTRSYPQTPALAGEKKDHPHHRSLWFTHGDVNGLDFWADHGHGHHKGAKNSILHREFVSIGSQGSSATLVTRNDWMSDDQKICEDERAVVFGVDGSLRWIDYTVTLKATEGDVTFGDTKEGSFAIRVAGSMKVDADLGGHIINSRGQTDAQAWGALAEWVDYTGPVDSEVDSKSSGETVGIAILSHPSNFRSTCRWHVRTYGLFAANPFGEHHFTESQSGSEPIQGAHTIAAGESLTLRYRVLFHLGDTAEANLPAAIRAFSQEQ